MTEKRKSKRDYFCTRCMAASRPNIYINKDNIEIYECATCQHKVVSHWIEDLDETVFDKPTLFIGSLSQAEDLLSEIEDKERKKAEKEAAKAAGVEVKDKPNTLYKISKIVGSDLYTVYYNTPLKATHTPEKGERLIMDLGAKLLEINEENNIELRNREDFFNYEAERIVDINNEEELSKRIKMYGDILFSSRIFQNACMVKLKEVIVESRKEFNLESLKQEKKASRKISAKAPDDKMYIQLAKVFGWTLESGDYDIERVKKYIADNKDKQETK